MTKTRLIPVLFIKNGLIVRSENFSYHQNIGNVISEASRYNDWNVDELVYVDISRTKEYDLRRDDYKFESYYTIEDIIGKIAEVCFMPLTFGGGIRTLTDINLRVKNGADKVLLNTGAFISPQLIKDSSCKYGSQCIVLSVDYKMVGSEPIVFVEHGQRNTGVSIFDWIKECITMGIGEVFLNSIERDGKAQGYDIETIGKVVEISSVPVVGCGGAGNIDHFIELAKTTKLSGIAAGNIFHFTERSYPRAKKILKENGLNFR